MNKKALQKALFDLVGDYLADSLPRRDFRDRFDEISEELLFLDDVPEDLRALRSAMLQIELAYAEFTSNGISETELNERLAKIVNDLSMSQVSFVLEGATDRTSFTMRGNTGPQKVTR